MLAFLDAFALAFVAAFLLGSIPFGLIVSKLFFNTDIREHGSGNIGTTNAIRTIGKAGGYAVFVLDFGKGLLSGFIALWVGTAFLGLRGYDAGTGGLVGMLAPFGLAPLGDAALLTVQMAETMLAVSFLGCTLGHIFSPWLKFKGGKGVATAVGCVFVAYGVLGAVILLALFAVIVALTRYVSVGSMIAGGACPFFSLLFYWGNWPAIICCFIVGANLVLAHHGNMKRLMAGTESRVGSKKKA